MAEPIDAVRTTIEAINRRDAAAVAATLSPDVAFVDAHGQRYEGRKKLMEGWHNYFATFPDYLIEIDKEQAASSGVLVLGHASASYHGRKDRAWRIPIAIRAETKDGLVSLWQVFADTHLPYESMR
ncbi:MAG: nuclear transport factor 2 family protein [Planctomycetes bacterium]|nr:nuclear transport factor 2 family protein [Planctomycetota bacterium]